MQKNVASQKLIVFAFDSTTNLPKTGDAANITAYVSKDYGSVTVLGDTSATEMDSTNAKGYYLFDLTAGETNADTLLFSAKSSTSNIVVIGVPARQDTTPPNFSLTSVDGSGRVDVIKINGTSQTARDLGASVLLSSGTGTGQLDFTAGVVKCNATQWLGGTIPAVNVTGVPLVDLKYTLGTLSAGVAGYVGIDWSHVNAPTTTVSLSGTTIGTLTTYTGNTVQTGDCYARLGAPAGASIAADLAEIEGETDGIAAIPTSNPTAAAIATAVWQDLLAGSDFGTAASIGKLLKDDVDAAVSSRMATYAQPSGFLAATFPAGTIASTTNITAGTITTAATVTTTTNLTNLPAIPAGWLTAAGIAAGALDGTAYASGTSPGGGSGGTFVLQTAAGADELITGYRVRLTAGTGSGQERCITAYTDSTKTASVSPAWVTSPDSTSAYTIFYGTGPGASSGARVLVDFASDTLFGAQGGTSFGTLVRKLDATISSRSTLAAGAAMTLTAAYDAAKTAAQAGDAMALTSGERNSVADALLDRTGAIETGLTPRGAFRLIVAAEAGKLSGAATTTVTIRNAVADSKARITATVDADGNRSAVTADVS